MVEHQVRHWVVIWCFLFVPQIETTPVYYSLVKSLFVWWSTSHTVKISIWAGGFQVIGTSHENPHIAEIPICGLNYQLVPHQPSAESVVSPSVLTETWFIKEYKSASKIRHTMWYPHHWYLNPLSRSCYINIVPLKKKHQFPLEIPSSQVKNPSLPLKSMKIR